MHRRQKVLVFLCEVQAEPINTKLAWKWLWWAMGYYRPYY